MLEFGVRILWNVTACGLWFTPKGSLSTRQRLVRDLTQNHLELVPGTRCHSSRNNISEALDNTQGLDQR